MEVEKVKKSLKIIHRMKKDLTELRRNWMLDYYDWHFLSSKFEDMERSLTKRIRDYTTYLHESVILIYNKYEDNKIVKKNEKGVVVDVGTRYIVFSQYHYSKNADEEGKSVAVDMKDIIEIIEIIEMR